METALVKVENDLIIALDKGIVLVLLLSSEPDFSLYLPIKFHKVLCLDQFLSHMFPLGKIIRKNSINTHSYADDTKEIY